jgi:hypothetical protein
MLKLWQIVLLPTSVALYRAEAVVEITRTDRRQVRNRVIKAVAVADAIRLTVDQVSQPLTCVLYAM